MLDRINKLLLFFYSDCGFYIGNKKFTDHRHRALELLLEIKNSEYFFIHFYKPYHINKVEYFHKNKRIHDEERRRLYEGKGLI